MSTLYRTTCNPHSNFTFMNNDLEINHKIHSATKFGAIYSILLLIYCPHRLPHRIPHSSTIQLHMYRFHTEYHYRTLWTNLAVSLSKQVHFAVFVLPILHPPALHSAISRMSNRTFPCCGLIFSFLGTRLIISAGQNLLACRIL